MKKNALITSIMTIVLCLSLIAGSSFALFTSESTVNVAVTSGTVDVTATVENFVKGSELGENLSETDISYVGNSVTMNRIVPGDFVTFDLRIHNASNVTVKYRTVLRCLEDNGLWSGLKITVGGADYSGATIASDWTTLAPGSEDIVVPVSVKLPTTAGNSYQGKTCRFTYTVEAIQGNASEHMWDGTADTESLTANTDTTAKTVTIATAEQLAAFAVSVNGGNNYAGYTATLTADIDLGSVEWTPIGNDTNPFNGTFDGGNHIISNLNINMPSTNSVGLFGRTNSGEVKNLTIRNATVKGSLNVGVVAGTPYTSKYSNISLTGLVKVDGFSYVGGLLGKNAYGDVTNIIIDVQDGSYVKADSGVYRSYAGGVVGFCGEGNHSFTNISSNIDVIGTTCDVGGIVGIAHYGNTFKGCHSSGNVSITACADVADADEIGGIAGVWMNKTSNVTFDGCTFTGTLTTSVPGVDISDNTIYGAAYYKTGTGLIANPIVK